MTNTATEKQTFKILAADKIAQEGLDWINDQPDAELTNKPGLSEDEYAQLIQEHDAMIVRSGVKVTAKMLENPGKLKIIARAGVGVDNIDLEAATARGILVVNTAEANTLTTAEHAFALMLGASRLLGQAYKTMAEGGWDRSKFKGRQLAGKTLGIVGFGRIGQAIAERAMAFDMTVVAYDPFINAKTAMDGEVRMFESFEQMLPELDYVTFHVPLNDQTRDMLAAPQFEQGKDSLIVINASRGGVINEADLAGAIDAGKCGGAGIDVYVDEPPAADSPLRNHPKILTTPHLGASTLEAQRAVSVDAAAACMGYLRGEGIKGAVNVRGLRVDLDPLQERFVDLARRMATLISPMVTRGIQSVSIELAGNALHPALGTIERTALIGLLSEHLDAPLNVINVEHVAESRGIKLRTVTVEEKKKDLGPQLTIQITGPADALAPDTPEPDKTRRIVGRVYDDLRPRVVEINGYHMDMVPAGDMVLIQNRDKPGVIGMVGGEFGQASVNIADMSISRRDTTALMLLKLDAQAPDSLVRRLKEQPGILRVAPVKLAPEAG